MLPKETESGLKERAADFRKYLKKMTGTSWRHKFSKKGDKLELKFLGKKTSTDVSDPTLLLTLDYNSSADTYSVREGYVNGEGKVEKTREIKDLDLGTIMDPAKILAGVLQFVPTKKVVKAKGETKKLVKHAKKIAEGLEKETITVGGVKYEMTSAKQPNGNTTYFVGNLDLPAAGQVAKYIQKMYQAKAKVHRLKTQKLWNVQATRYTKESDPSTPVEEAVSWSDMKPGTYLVNNTASSTWWYKVIGEPLKNGNYPVLQVVDYGGKPSKAAKKSLFKEEMTQLKVIAESDLPPKVKARFGIAESIEEARSVSIQEGVHILAQPEKSNRPSAIEIPLRELDKFIAAVDPNKAGLISWEAKGKYQIGKFRAGHGPKNVSIAEAKSWAKRAGLTVWSTMGESRLEEAKALPVGTTRERGGKTYVKTQQGWKYQAKGRSSAKGTSKVASKAKKPLPKKAKAKLAKAPKTGTTAKVSKKERLADLRKAQDLAFKGKHRAAKALFSKHGISYVTKNAMDKAGIPPAGGTRSGSDKTKNLGPPAKKDDDKTKVLSSPPDSKQKAKDVVSLPAVPQRKSDKLEKLKGALKKLRKVVSKYV